MDKKQLIRWLVPVLARGVAWVLAAWLGVSATESDSLGIQIAEAVGALALVGVSIYTSVQGRKKLAAGAAAEPPETRP